MSGMGSKVATVLLVICVSLVIATNYHIEFKTDCSSSECQSYLATRKNLVNEEEALYYDANESMNDQENAADQLLEQLRNEEMRKTFFSPSFNFRDVKEAIEEKSKIFPLLKKMPKGAVLHNHGFMDSWFIIRNGTYRDDCYMNTATNKYAYFNNPPSGSWVKVNALRAQSKNVTAFDYNLWLSTQFFTPDDTIGEDPMWEQFDNVIRRISLLGFYSPVWEAAIMDGFQKLVDDGIQHIELRGIHKPYGGSVVYGNTTKLVEKYLDMLNQFNLYSSQKLTMRWIVAAGRNLGRDAVWMKMMEAVNLRQQFPDLVIGFDLVDEEDRFYTLLHYLDLFMKMDSYTKSNNMSALSYYFHAGETFWNKKSHENLYDAILLNTKRVGHGLALKDHPILMQMMIQQNIAVELNPISNQLLRYIPDMRNHPAVVMMNNGVPVTISNDDPMIYGYNGLSYDFYTAYMSWNITLRDLKQLTQNSLEYSSLRGQDLSNALDTWQQSWKDWILWLNSQKNSLLM
jgi:adenosine deaminase CECR1